MSDFDKVGFLKTCIMASEIKIDFQKVANELKINRQAAYMRYQRMTKPDSKTVANRQNLEYLQTCFRVSEVKLDFKKIGDILGIKQTAAYMRYQRIMKAAAKPANAASSGTESSPTKKRGALTPKAFGSAKKQKITAPKSETDTDSEADDDFLSFDTPMTKGKDKKEEKLKVIEKMSRNAEGGVSGEFNEEDGGKKKIKGKAGNGLRGEDNVTGSETKIEGESGDEFDDFLDVQGYLYADSEGMHEVYDDDMFEV